MFEDGTLSKNLKASFEQIAKDCNIELDKIIDELLSLEQQATVKALTAMPGIKETAAKNIIAVIGIDMS